MKPLYAALCSALFIAKAGAADYSAGFALDTQASHNDNIRLVQTDKTAVTKYDLSPKLTLGINTETNKLELTSDFNFNRYSRSEFDSDDQNIALALSHQFENSSLGLNAGYIHNSTLTSELLTSGRIGTKAERAEQYTLSPNWNYSPSETNLIQLSATYMTQNYEGTGYIGYKNAGAELDWIHMINERIKLITAASYSDYRSDDASFAVYQLVEIFPGFTFPITAGTQSYSTHTQTKDIQLGAEYQITESSVLKAQFGRSRNDTTYPVKDSSDLCSSGAQLIGAVCASIPHSVDFGTTAQLSWRWSNERQAFNLSTTKQTQPTSNGYTVNALQLGSSWSYQLTELDKVSASLSIIRNRAIDKQNSLSNTSIADRDYGSATVQYQRQLTEQWFFNTSFAFSGQKYTDVDYRASSRMISLGILYQPTQWHWAR